MRLIVFGTAGFAVPCLERLAGSPHPVAGCVTQPDRPKGRGWPLQPSPVKEAATRLGLRVLQPARLTRRTSAGLEADLGVVIAYGNLIPRELLAWPRHGMLGLHPSLLPKYRGAAPVAWALLRGESTTGVTIFRLTERMDAGPILSQRAMRIEAGEDAETLTARLAQLGAQELLRAIESIEGGTARFVPQDESQASLAPKLTKGQGWIDWTVPAAEIERLVRATAPWPGALTSWGETTLRVWKAGVGEEQPRSGPADPGQIIDVTAETVSVAAGDGYVMLHEVQLAGRTRMMVREFLIGHQMQVGDRLGTARPGEGAR